MFKKIEIWILYLTILFCVPVTVGFGILVRQELVGTSKLGKISEAALFLAEIPKNIKILMVKKEYVEDRFSNLSGFNGIGNSQESYLLLSKRDGNLNEGIVELIDLQNFKVLHTWNADINAFNDLVDNVNLKYVRRDSNNSRALYYHPKLMKDGSLIFHNKAYSPLRKIDACSKLVFQNTKDNFHHSIETDLDGNIWVSTHLYPQLLPAHKVSRNTQEDLGYFDDSIIKLSPDGKILFEKSLSQIFIDNGLENLLFGFHRYDYDPLHLNDIQPVDFDGKFWKKGDIFLSLRHQSMVLLYRPSINKILWKGTGPFFQQHDVDILDDHRISIFNNNSKSFYIGNIVDGNNEVIIYDFKTNKYSQYLSEALSKNNVKTLTEGRSEILPNGDLFIEESNFGRTLYFNSNGSLRWTHVNRADDGNVYRVGWSRILYKNSDILVVNNFLQNKGNCND